MKKLFTLLTLALLGITAAWGAEETFNFKFNNETTGWTTSYSQHTVIGNAATVEFKAASKQANIITDYPVTKGSDITVTLDEEVASKITGFKLTLIQWSSKDQTVTLHTSENGTDFTSTSYSSANFALNVASGLSAKAIKFTFSSSSNQVGVKELILYYEEASSATTVAKPTFNPAGGTYNSTQSVTLSCATTGASIYYTTNGSEPTTASTPYNGAITVSETTTIKAIAAKEGMANSGVASATYTITSSSGGNGEMTFQRVTNVSDLIVGEKYIIVYESAGYALEGDGGYDGTSITIDNHTTTIESDDNVGVFTLGSGYTLKYPDGKYLVNIDDSKGLRKQENSQNWTIAFTDNNAVITGTGGRFIRYYSQDFRTYTNNNGSAIQLYKQIITGAYNINIASGIEHGTVTSSRNKADQGNPVTITVTPDEGYELGSLSVDGTDVTSSVSGNSYTFTMPGHDVSVTATFALTWNTVGYTITPESTGSVWMIGGTTVKDGVSKSQMGTLVTVKVVSNGYGYAINTVAATDANGNTVPLTAGETNDNHGGWGTYYTFSMPSSAVTINASFKQGDLYILGTANGNQWAGNVGVKMDYDSANEKYHKDVYFANDTYGYFSFTEHLGNADYSSMGTRYGAANNNKLISSGQAILYEGQNSFKIPAGIYTIEVNKNKTQLTVTPKEITVTLTPNGGQVEQGTTVTVSSNLAALLQAINSGLNATLSTSTDGTNYTDGNTYTFGSTGTTTVSGKAAFGAIEKTESAEFTVVKHYNVSCTANPAAGGTISASTASAQQGETVTLTITTKEGYELTSVTVNGDEISAVDGVYSFNMPAQNAAVVANFATINYAINVVKSNCEVDVTSPAAYNSLVTFTVTPRSDKYEVTSVTVTYGENGTKPVINNGNGTYSFYMPASDVTLTVVCTKKAVGNVYTLVEKTEDLVSDQKYIILAKNYTAAMSTTLGSKSTNYTLSDDKKKATVNGEDVLILTLNEVTVNDGTEWTLVNNDKYLNLPSGGDLAWSNTPESFPITISNGVATINGYTSNSSERQLLYRNTGVFKNYASSNANTSGYSVVQLYKQTTAATEVTIEPNGGNVIGSQDIVVDASTETAVVRYKVDEGEWSEWATGPVNFTLSGNVGDNKVVYAEAKEPNQEIEQGEEEEVDSKSATYTFVAPSAPSITPASCSVVDVKQNVTISSEYITTYDNAVVEYSTDGGGTWTAYSNPFDVILEGFGSSVTVLARVTVNGVQSEEASATYTRDIQPVVFSPVSGTYYYGKQSVEMFSITKGARIYYTMTDDGSEPVVPEMNQEGTYLYSSPIEDLQPGKTYKFKAVAYIGTTHSVVTDATYTIRAAQSGSYWPNIAAMNAEEDGTADKDLENPVQVVYMSTYENNGYKPEFAYIRDNSGYGLVYFGSSGVTDYNNSKKFQMGDWLAGSEIGGKVSVWSDGFHNELGSRGATVTSWPSTSVGNTPIIPETVTNAQIKAGWDDDAYSTTYASGVTSSNLWGHYVHLRNNTLANVADRTSSDRKHKGVMTDPTNTTLTYYDVFYKFSGHNGAPHYDQSFFDARQRKGATFDFYGIVAFFGPDIDNDDYANQPFQIVPLDILWVYQPKISGVEAGQTYTAAQTVSLDIDAVTGDDESHAVIWYKTSEMDDYAIYTGPFEVSTTTTIEAYTTKMTQYNDQMESNHVTMQVEFTTINPPVISPESHVYTITDPAINATIMRDESDGLQAKVWFTTDGSDPADNNNDNRYEYTAENVASYLTGIHATTTVRAIAEVEGVYSAEAEPQTYTFVKSNGVVYDLVTNVNQLTENGVYMIVSQKYGEALSVVQNEANRGAAGVMFVDDTKQKVYGNSDAALFQLTSLTHGDDQSGIQRFLFHTGSSTTEAANGYLCVGSEDDNTLLTEAEEDALGNDVVAVTIDADGRAHLSLNYSGGSDRYVQYWNRDRYFTTYKTEVDDRAVYIYYTASTPLAVIEKSGKVGNSYTIADDLQVVWINPSKGLAWARDLVDNINAVEIPEFGEGESDYVQAAGLMNGRPWKQNNWVMLDFNAVYDNFAEQLNEVVKGTHRVIKGGTLSGVYTDNTNYTIVLSADTEVQLSETQIPNYEPNVYCPANYGANNEGWQTSSQHDTKRYWFMTPKVMEVCTHTWSVWHVADEMHKGFYMAERNMTDYQQPINEAGLVGAYSVDMKYNTVAAPSLSEGDAYQFLSVVMLPEQRGNNAPRRAEQVTPHDVQPGSELSKSAVVYPLDLEVDEDHIITAVSQLAADRQVVSVTYCDVAGRQSSKPFDGINIVVTRYSDGTTEACKILK